MILSHFRPGHLTYMQVTAEAPGAVHAFGVWLASRYTWQLAITATERARDATSGLPKGQQQDRANQRWRDAGELSTAIGTSSSKARLVVADLLKEAGIENPYDWLESKWRELEAESERAVSDRAA